MEGMEEEKPRQVEREVAGLYDDETGFSGFGVAIFLVVIVEIGLLFFLNLYQKSRVETLTKEIESKRTELDSGDNGVINQQMEQALGGSTQLQTVLAQKVRWSKFYSALNAVTPRDVRLTSFSVSQDGAFRADGQTSSLASLARLLVAWQKGSDKAATPFSSVELMSNGYVSEGSARAVSFSVSGQINLEGLR